MADLLSMQDVESFQDLPGDLARLGFCSLIVFHILA